MNLDTDTANKIWDEFLSAWPLERVKTMSLAEYTNVGNKDTFIYWIEKRLDQMGSIWGGSSFKFGVYERGNSEAKESGRGRSYDLRYAWYSKYGDTAEQAFENVRKLIVAVVEAAQSRELTAIDEVDLGDAYKWKVAFHYQDRNNPMIVNVFLKEPLVYYLKEATAVDKPFSYIYSQLLAKKPEVKEILRYGDEIWDHWVKHLRIWKMSHGDKDFRRDEIEKYLRDNLISIYPKTKKGQGSAFQQEMREGDFIYLCYGNNEILLLGKVLSGVNKSSYREDWIERKYQVLKKPEKFGSYSGEKKGWTPNYNSTLKLVPPAELDQFESLILKPYFKVSLSDLPTLEGEVEMETSSQMDEDLVQVSTHSTLPANKQGVNLILYGPPGTGKTYELARLFDDFKTDNSDESEESYLARLVSDKPWWQVVGAAVLDKKKTRVPALLMHPLIQAKLSQTSIQSPNARLWATLQSHTVQDCPNLNYQRRLEPQFFWKDTDSTWSLKEDLLPDLAPEIIQLRDQSVKIPTAEIVKRYEFVTFHQSYGYEEFVEGIRPVMEGTGEGELEYRVEPGVFKKICQRAEKDPANHYAIFIDEINRGNISKIFGELITLIELDKRVTPDGKGMRARLPYSKEEFGVPANLSIIGTMNTADRSIAFIDIALRRRFQFREMMPNLDLIAEKVGENGVVDGVNVRELLHKINRRIEFLYDRDHMIGHSYFLNCSNLEHLKIALLQSIIPLLQEYFYGDWEKICLVLGCGTNGNGGGVKNQSPIIRAERLVEKEVLGLDHLDFNDCCRYEVCSEFSGSSGDLLRKYLAGIYQPSPKMADAQEG